MNEPPRSARPNWGARDGGRSDSRPGCRRRRQATRRIQWRDRAGLTPASSRRPAGASIVGSRTLSVNEALCFASRHRRRQGEAGCLGTVLLNTRRGSMTRTGMHAYAAAGRPALPAGRKGSAAGCCMALCASTGFYGEAAGRMEHAPSGPRTVHRPPGRVSVVLPGLHQVGVGEEGRRAVVLDVRVPEEGARVRAPVDLVLLVGQQILDLGEGLLAFVEVELAALLLQQVVERLVVDVAQVDAGAGVVRPHEELLVQVV